MPIPAEDVSNILGLKKPSTGDRVTHGGWTLAVLLALATGGLIAVVVGLCRVVDMNDPGGSLVSGALTALLLIFYAYSAVGAGALLLFGFAVLELLRWKMHWLASVPHRVLFRRVVIIPILVITILYFGAALVVVAPIYLEDLAKTTNQETQSRTKQNEESPAIRTAEVKEPTKKAPPDIAAQARKLPSPLTERAVRKAMAGFSMQKNTPPSLAEARKILEYLGARTTVQTAENAMQGIFDDEDVITIWIQSYGKPNVYGVRFNGPAGRYGGGNATYFEISK